MIQTIPYKNGNLLSCTQYGHPQGWPILIQHGMIASIRSVGLFQRLVDEGARIISAARPGYGESSPYEMGCIAEWGDITAALVDALGLAHFDVFGISSGAPYSYAIGWRLPERVRNIYILSGTPALYDDQVLSCWPYPVDKKASLADLQVLARDLFFTGLPESALEQDDIKDSMRNNCFGVALDLKIRCLDWGFRLQDLQNRVFMRHSQADTSVPFATAQITSGFLPNCQFEVRDHDPHFSQEVLDDFIQTVVIQ